jgi:hypothetical protein
MIAWLSVAFAQVPMAPLELVWARPFALEQPEVYTMQAERPSFTDGLLIELRADPALLGARQVAEPVLYVGGVPAFRFNWDPTGGCLVVFVPGTLDLETTEIFFGPPELPERITAMRGASERAIAVAAGVRPLSGSAPARTAGGDVLRTASLEGVYAEAMARVAACTQTPSDLRRSGIPGQPSAE